jgi:hypothetical protein
MALDVAERDEILSALREAEVALEETRARLNTALIEIEWRRTDA